ncbi:MAG: hypothetical protein GC161_15090 [Planctomycetaceae bacterium]|nr:hypothetical protein [Planctomycetaceae bacterium]
MPLRVRFRDTGEPIPGATIESIGRSQLRPESDRVAHTRKLAKGFWEDRFSALAPGKPRYRADANGWVRVEVEGHQQILLARAERDGVSFGGQMDLPQARQTQGDGELVLYLDPLVHRWVELRDAAGAVVPDVQILVLGSLSPGVPVPYHWLQPHGDRIAVAAGRTDSKGRVRLEQRSAPWSALSDLRIAVDLLFDPPVEVPCSAEVTGPLVEVMLPPAGEVHVRGATRWAILELDEGQSPRFARALRQGELVRFPHVGLGLRLRAGDGLYFQAKPHHFAGPTLAGEIVEVELPNNARLSVHGMTKLRLVDSAGAPVADRVVAVNERRPSQGHLYDALTDVAGGIEFAPQLATEANDWVLILETLSDSGDKGGRLRGELDHWDETWTQREVTLWPAPVLCSGRVVDAVGQPVEGVEVWIERMQADLVTPSFPQLDDPKSTTDQSGRFVLHGVLESLDEGDPMHGWRWYVSARKSGYPEPTPVEFVHGHSLELVLPRPAELTFEILWPSAMERASVSLSIQGGGATGWVREVPGSLRALSTDVHSVRYTTFDGPSGPAEILAHSRIDGATLGQWAVFGAPLERRSLPSFDWTSAFDLAPLEVRFHDGEPGGQLVLQFELDGDTRHVVLQLPLASNPVLLPKPLAAMPFHARAPGQQSLEGTWDGSPQMLAFARGWEVRFVLPGHLAVPTEHGALSVQLQADGPTHESHWLQQRDDGSFQVTLSSLDRWRVQAWLAESDHPLGPRCEIKLDTASLEAGLSVDLPFDPLEWRAWIDRLAED